MCASELNFPSGSVAFGRRKILPVRPVLCIPGKIGQLNKFGKVCEESYMERGGRKEVDCLLAAESSDWTDGRGL